MAEEFIVAEDGKGSLEEAGSNRRRGGRGGGQGARTELEHSAKAFLQCRRTSDGDVGLQLYWALGQREKEGSGDREREIETGRETGIRAGEMGS